MVKDGEVHMQLLDAIKKEFKDTRRLWRLLHEQLSAADEIGMCKQRIQLKNEGTQVKKENSKALKNLSYERPNATDQINLIDEYEVNLED